MTTYFSQKEFAAVRAEIIGLAAVRWLALSGKPLTATEATKLALYAIVITMMV